MSSARLTGSSTSGPRAAPAAGDAAEAFWAPEAALDGFGRPLQDLTGLAPVAAADLLRGPAPGIPAGVYASGERRRHRA